MPREFLFYNGSFFLLFYRIENFLSFFLPLVKSILLVLRLCYVDNDVENVGIVRFLSVDGALRVDHNTFPCMDFLLIGIKVNGQEKKTIFSLLEWEIFCFFFIIIGFSYSNSVSLPQLCWNLCECTNKLVVWIGQETNNR